MKISDLDVVFYHQVGALSEPIVEGGVKHGINRDKWKDTFYKYGNIGMNDMCVNLTEMWEEGKIPKNSIIALYTWYAGGGHSPCLIIKWLAERKR